MIRGIVVGALALLMGAIALAADIDDTRLLAAATDPASWLTYGRDYGNQRFSPLSGIDASNVTRLAPRWIYQSGVSATFQATPWIQGPSEAWARTEPALRTRTRNVAWKASSAA